MIRTSTLLSERRTFAKRAAPPSGKSSLVTEVITLYESSSRLIAFAIFAGSFVYPQARDYISLQCRNRILRCSICPVSEKLQFSF
jgi:hypothetical protein